MIFFFFFFLARKSYRESECTTVQVELQRGKHTWHANVSGHGMPPPPLPPPYRMYSGAKMFSTPKFRKLRGIRLHIRHPV